MNAKGMKRKALQDVTNLDLDVNQGKSDYPNNAIDLMPDLRNCVKTISMINVYIAIIRTCIQSCLGINTI